MYDLIFFGGMGLICLTKALIDWRSYSQDADARLVDIAVDPDRWLRRLKRWQAGKVHNTVYNALTSVNVKELAANRKLCRQLGKHINPVYALRLLNDGDHANRRFWAVAYRTERFLPPDTVDAVIDVPSAVV